MYMKLVVLDGYTENPGDLDWRGMEALGDLTVYARTDHSQVKERMQDADAVIINKVPMTRELMQESKQLRYIGVLATGYDVVDIEAASDLHIAVTNVPGCTVCHCTFTGGDIQDRASCKTCKGERMGKQCGLVFLGLSANGAVRQNNGDHRIWTHWKEGR